MKRNVASQSVGAQMTSASDGSAFTGAVSVAVTKDNGTQTAGGGTAPAHEGNGYHSYSPTQAETDADHIAFTFTGTGAIPVTVQVYTTFPQTGDSFARLGAPAGASVSADIAAIEAQTDDIGVAGAGLTAVPWNSAWDAEVQSEVADALDAAVPVTPTADSINERIKTMDDADLPGDVAAVQSDTNDIQARLPAALVGGRMAANAEVVGDKTGYAIGTGGIGAGAIAANAITSAELDASATPRVLKNAALNNFPFLMVDSTDHVTPETGIVWATGDAQVSIDGAAFANLTNLPTEVAAGVYKINLVAADLNGDTIVLKFSKTGADTRVIVLVTQP